MMILSFMYVTDIIYLDYACSKRFSTPYTGVIPVWVENYPTKLKIAPSSPRIYIDITVTLID